MQLGSYSPPECWGFRPFFTIQPIKLTKEKQLKLWKDIILEYHIQNNVFSMNLATCCLFENRTIDRKVSASGIREIAEYLVSMGNGEWEDSSKASVRILFRTPGSVAVDIYNWALKNNHINEVFTFFELHSGDEHQDSGFFQTDPFLFQRAIALLERERKCIIIPGDTRDEDGIKFISVS